MAFLRSCDDKTIVYLKPVHILGRDPNSADTVLNGAQCSRMHCVFRWQGEQWFVTDGSKNGCYINGDKIEKGKSVCINKGDVFSVSQDGTEQWVVENTLAPRPVLVCESGLEFRELSSINLLPSEEEPCFQILQQRGYWFLEKGNDFFSISEGYQIEISAKTWRFFPNDIIAETEVEETNIDVPTLHLSVSRDDEHVALDLQLGDELFHFGHKNHHCVLLELARHKLRDNTAMKTEHGWMENELLLHTLGLDYDHLNIMIYRNRSAIKKYSSYWGQNIIERRRGETRLRDCRLVINEDMKKVGMSNVTA